MLEHQNQRPQIHSMDMDKESMAELGHGGLCGDAGWEWSHEQAVLRDSCPGGLRTPSSGLPAGCREQTSGIPDFPRL